MNAFTDAERDWEPSLPGEDGNLAATLLRGIFTAIDQCLTEAGRPLDYWQRQVLRDALAQNVGAS